MRGCGAGGARRCAALLTMGHGPPGGWQGAAAAARRSWWRRRLAHGARGRARGRAEPRVVGGSGRSGELSTPGGCRRGARRCQTRLRLGRALLFPWGFRRLQVLSLSAPGAAVGLSAGGAGLRGLSAQRRVRAAGRPPGEEASRGRSAAGPGQAGEGARGAGRGRRGSPRAAAAAGQSRRGVT